MTKEEFKNYPLDLKLIREIAFMKIEGIEEHDSFIIELFLKTLYYYNKETEKEIDIKLTFEGMNDFLMLCFKAANRKTDLLDALYLMHSEKYSEESLFEKTYKQLFAELGTHRRTSSDLEKLYADVGAKFDVYYRNLA